jgi:hypothetical protein
MKKIGIVSCNKYTNFTNYGTVLQSWALNKVIKQMGYQPVLVNYCPDRLLDKDPLNPFKNMWDQDEESQRLLRMTMPAIRVNYKKIMDFYASQFINTKRKYTKDNFNNISDENIDGYVCGSDTIFCYNEFGFDNGFFANYEPMKDGRSVAYAASFGDTDINAIDTDKLNSLLANFQYIALRESTFVDYTASHVNVPVRRVVDPTVLLTAGDYSEIVAPRQVDEKYLLMYSRRYNPEMEAFADKVAKENGWKVVEISLRANNADRHIMRYDAGVEEFLSLVKNAEYVVTNSFHGMIFSTLFNRDYNAFVREEGNTKIEQLLQSFGLADRIISSSAACPSYGIDYGKVQATIQPQRENSLYVLKEELNRLKI